MTKRIILASKSPYRKKLLNQLGIKFDCIPSTLDESILKAKISNPKELTLELALEKAKIIAKKYEDCIVIGSDQVCLFENKILGKTGSLDISFEQLKEMQGKEHELITSYAIVNNEEVIKHTNITKLTMKALSNDQIKFYLNTDNPIDCAGSYKLELNGISLFNKIETTDHTAIIGIPLIQLGKDLTKLGVQVPPSFD